VGALVQPARAGIECCPRTALAFQSLVERRGLGPVIEAGTDVEVLGQDIKMRKEQLLAQIKSSGLPVPKTRTYTGHKLQQGKPEVTVRHAA
jgi:hypothetical protein